MITWDDFEKVELRIGPFLSECLVTGVQTEKGAVTLVRPEAPVDNGERLF
ncbi:hypothetical protein [Marinobacter sediminicola]|nr:hypothetical protein [Marinobacter sp. F26243]